MKRCFYFLALFLTLTLNVACFAQEPDVPTTELKVSGVKEKVIVRRDDRGIPYIEAANEADLFFAQGYATASDRLWQMDLVRRVARGETAEIFGTITLAEDKRWRKFGFVRIAEDSFKLISPELRIALENYARGVNAYIATLNEKTLPSEFQVLQYRPREWKPEDSIVIGKILADGLSSTWDLDLQRAMLSDLPADKYAQLFNPSTPDDVLLMGKDLANSKFQIPNSKVKAAKTESGIWNLESGIALAQANEVRRRSLERIGFYAEDLAASNNWVVSGKRTADGKPILANDPHLPAITPPVWHMVNLSAPGIHVAGVTFPGTPGVVLGHNENIAWGATNVGPDVQDLYLEQFDPKNPRRYKTPSGWQEAEVRREEIKVRKSFTSPETTSEFLDVTKTRNGVIYHEQGGKRYSLKWTAFDPKNNEFEAFALLIRAKNWEDFKRALRSYGGSTQNFVFADTSGNIGWIAAGRIPIRKTGDGALPYDGTTDDGAWTGFVPFEELPQLYNPPDGLIVTANQRIVGTSYKYQQIVRDFDSPYRARRISDLLNAKPKLTLENMRDIQHDTFNIAISRFAREIVNHKAASDDTLKLLGNWDGKMSADSKAALIANEIRLVFRRRILEANLGAERSGNIGFGMLSAFLDWVITNKPKNWLPKEFTDYTMLLRACETEARANLTKRLGSDEAKWTWGGANKINFPHPLASVPFIGSQFAIEPLSLNGSSGVPNVGTNVSMRLIATPGDWDKTRQVITSGESGIPTSAHYKDQVDAWYKGNTPVFPFTPRAVKNAMKEKLILVP
jgi:penicillin amidase